MEFLSVFSAFNSRGEQSELAHINPFMTRFFAAVPKNE
jgi:hypothetical protein